MKRDIKLKHPLKVCVLSGYPPGIGRGAEQVYNLLEELKQYDDLEISVLANQITGAPLLETKAGLRIIRIWRPGAWGSAIKTICKVIKLKPDILHVHHPHLYYGGAIYTAIFILFLLSVTKLMGIKSLVWWEHVYPPDKITGSTMKTYRYRASPAVLRIGLRFYTYLIGRLTTRVLVQTNSDLVAIKKHYRVRNATCLIIGMAGKKLDKHFAKNWLGLGGDKKVLLIFGFISPFKGIEQAIGAFPKLQLVFPNTILLIAGSAHPRLKDNDAYVKTLKEAARNSSSAKDIVFRDVYIPAGEHSFYYSSAEVVLLPYISSLGPSSVGMEAFLHGVPVIASELDFIRNDIQDGVSGLLVPAGNSAALADAIIRLFNDNELYHRIVTNISAVAGHYSVEEVAKQLRNVYQSL